MLSNEEISERNGYLIALVAEVSERTDSVIHVTELPHKPKLLNEDYTKQLNCYVNNFHLILKGGNDEVFYEIKLKSISEIKNLDEVIQKIIEWIAIFEHTRVYTVSLMNTDLFVTGFNHHNKILKTNAYPVFARYSPICYYDLQRAEDIVYKFDKYNLVINNKSYGF